MTCHCGNISGATPAAPAIGCMVLPAGLLLVAVQVSVVVSQRLDHALTIFACHYSWTFRDPFGADIAITDR